VGSGRIKVALIIATLERGGAEKQLYLLATHLDRKRFEPLVIALTRGGPYQRALQDRGVECEVIGKSRSISPGALLGLVRALRRRRPDVVHTWMFTANAYGRAAARIARVRGLIAEEQCVDLWKGPVRLGVDRVLARMGGRVVANSASVAEWLCSVGIPGALIETIPAAFDPAGYPLKAPARAAAPVQAPRLCAVGRLYPQKRYDVLLKAMAHVVRACPQASLTIAGEGPCRPQLEQLVVRLGLAGSVRLRGEFSAIGELLLGSDLFLMASDYEGLPNAVLEAMYVGVPVVATAAPGTVDLVQDGVTGVLVPRGEGEALGEAAAALLGDPERRRALVERARHHVLAVHSVEQMVRAHERLYELCAAGG